MMDTKCSNAEKLVVPAHLDSLTQVREFAEKYGRKHGFSRENINCLKITVDEICTNIALHAYKGMERGDICIEIERKNGTVVTHIVDSGMEFDYSSVKTPDLGEYVEKRMRGGLGLHLVKTLNDEILYRRVGNRNILTISKHLEGRS